MQSSTRLPILLPALFLLLFLISYLLPSFDYDFPKSHPTPLPASASATHSNPTTTTKPPLKLTPARTFKLAIFSDLHFGEEESSWGVTQDINSLRVMRGVLEAEGPDFVVLDGDLITGENTFRENATGYVDLVVGPMVESGVGWGSAYGNHDESESLRREGILERERGYGLCYTGSMGGGPGVTNYYLVVWDGGYDGHTDADGDGNGQGKGEGEEEGDREGKPRGKPAVILWFFDSRGGQRYGDGATVPGWVAPETAEWARKQSVLLRQRYGHVPSLGFVHIPPSVFIDAQLRLAGREKHFPGLDDDVPLAAQDSPQDQAFMDTLLGMEGLHSLYVGHDHGNSWCVPWSTVGGDGGVGRRGPVLCFAKHTGYGGYGEWNRGARIVELRFGGGGGVDGLQGRYGDDDGKEDEGGEDGYGYGHGNKYGGDLGEMHVETWVRMENGDVIQRVMLNETYGMDEYPTDTGE